MGGCLDRRSDAIDPRRGAPVTPGAIDGSAAVPVSGYTPPSDTCRHYDAGTKVRDHLTGDEAQQWATSRGYSEDQTP